MAKKINFEQLLEYVVNGETAKADELFHQLVVQKSREIYEGLIEDEMKDVDIDEESEEEDDMVDETTEEDDEEMEEGIEVTFAETDDETDAFGGDPTDDLAADVGDDGESDDDGMDMDNGDDMGMGDEMGGDDMGGEEEVEGMYMEAEEEDDEKEEEEDDEKDVAESRRTKSEAERIREYVEKVSGGADKTEGGEVGKGGSTPINKQSIVAKKNDMGGTTANIVKGGSEQNPDGKQYKAPSNAYTKGQGTLKGAERNVNQPGGNKGAQDYYNTKATAKKPEGSTTDGSVSVDKQSILKKIK